MRKQYHFRPGPLGLRSWDVERLIRLTKAFPVKRIPLEAIRELDEPYWFSQGGAQPTCRVLVEHARLIEEAELEFPIILSADGRVMDGMHRVAKAALLALPEVIAVQFEQDPEPDFVGVQPDELPY